MLQGPFRASRGMTEITRSMEKRSAVNILFLVAGLGLAAAIGLLLVKVRAEAPAPEIDPAELARAQARASLAAQPSRASGSSRPTGEQADVWAPGIRRRPADGPSAAEVGIERLGAAGLAGAAAGGAVAEEETDDPAALPLKMTEATRLYDRGDYEGASAAADEVLAEQPDNVKMLRVAVSAACIMGDEQRARGYYERLPPRDQRQMARRCRRYSVEF